jgi:hypothetical protein
MIFFLVVTSILGNKTENTVSELVSVATLHMILQHRNESSSLLLI